MKTTKIIRRTMNVISMISLIAMMTVSTMMLTSCSTDEEDDIVENYNRSSVSATSFDINNSNGSDNTTANHNYDRPLRHTNYSIE